MEREPLRTAAMASEDLAGTTFTTFSPALHLGLMAVYDPSSNQLMLHIRSGASEWQSEWLECESRSAMPDMVVHIQEAVRLWLLRTGLPSQGQKNGLTPPELATRTIQQFEHCLA